MNMKCRSTPNYGMTRKLKTCITEQLNIENLLKCTHQAVPSSQLLVI